MKGSRDNVGLGGKYVSLQVQPESPGEAWLSSLVAPAIFTLSVTHWSAASAASAAAEQSFHAVSTSNWPGPPRPCEPGPEIGSSAAPGLCVHPAIKTVSLHKR